jgi:CHASE1-domain containing sensor protein
MRWLFAVATLLALALGFRSHSPGWMGFLILLGLVGLLATGLAFAQARIGSQARAPVLSEYELRMLRGSLPHNESTPDR